MATYIKELPSKEFLNFYYYEEGGFVKWKQRRMSKGRKSVRAGRLVNTSEDDSGYLRVVLKGENYSLARIVYQMHHGDLTPEFEIDHIDKNKHNKIENLRKVPQEVNKRNKPRQKNASKETGVCLNVKTNEWGTITYWVARWYDIDGVLRGKHFRIYKLGDEQAFKLACEYRSKMIEQLNAQGAGYTETHGQ